MHLIITIHNFHELNLMFTLFLFLVPIVSLEPGEHRVRGTSGNVTLIITRRGNIQTPVALHLTSDFIDPVGEVHLLSGELRREVTITVRTRLLPMATEIVTVLLSHSGNEDIILVHTEANITVLDGMAGDFFGQNFSLLWYSCCLFRY